MKRFKLTVNNNISYHDTKQEIIDMNLLSENPSKYRIDDLKTGGFTTRSRSKTGIFKDHIYGHTFQPQQIG